MPSYSNKKKNMSRLEPPSNRDFIIIFPNKMLKQTQDSLKVNFESVFNYYLEPRSENFIWA